MKRFDVSVPELAFVAATRAIAGVGVGLVLGEHLDARSRRAVGLALIGIGVLTTLPIAREVLGRVRTPATDEAA